MTRFRATHEIVFRPRRGRVQRTRVMLLDGAAYDRDEWDADERASWERDERGVWTCCGQTTPGGEAGTVEVRELPRSNRARHALQVMLTDDEREAVELAAGVEADPHASAREATAGAWARRVLLREAERVRGEGK